MWFLSKLSSPSCSAERKKRQLSFPAAQNDIDYAVTVLVEAQFKWTPQIEAEIKVSIELLYCQKSVGKLSVACKNLSDVNQICTAGRIWTWERPRQLQPGPRPGVPRRLPSGKIWPITENHKCTISGLMNISLLLIISSESTIY